MLSLTQAATSFSQKRILCLTHCFQRRSSVALRWYCSPGMEMFAGTESDRSLGFIISPSQTTKRLQSKLKNLCFFLRKYCKFPPWEQFASWPCPILPNLLATLHSPITWIRNKSHLCLFSHMWFRLETTVLALNSPKGVQKQNWSLRFAWDTWR